MAKINQIMVTPKYIFEDIRRLQEENKLSLEIAVYLTARFYGHKLWCPLSSEEKTKVDEKYLLKGLVDTSKLSFSNPSLQMPLQIPKLIGLAIDSGVRCTDANLDESTKIIIDNLTKAFLNPEDLTETNFINKGKTLFNGDMGPVKYYLIFKALFPSKENINLNKHFGIEYTNSDRFSGSSATLVRFSKIYKEHDMGIFLYGTYLCLKDSINQNTSFMPGTGKFLDNYKEWYNKAEKALLDRKQNQILLTTNTCDYDGSTEM